MTGRRRVVVVGLDSITPVMIDRFLADGAMPNLARLRDRGWSAEVVPTMPPTSPPGWATIATGAWPGTHGVDGFVVRDPAGPPDAEWSACGSERVRAEFLWEAAERHGRRPVLLKFPMSWPPVGGPGLVQVDGAAGWGGLKCVFDLVHSGCWDTAAPGAAEGDGEAAVDKRWQTRDQDNLDEERAGHLPVLPADRWVGPVDGEPLWASECVLAARGGAGQTVRLLVVRRRGRDAVAFAVQGPPGSPQPDVVEPGRWTGWLPLALPVGGVTRHGEVRFKVLELDAAERRLKLYQSQVHDDAGFTRPEELAAELVAAAGPFVEWTESYDRLQGWIDDATQLEIYEQHVEWMSAAAGHLLRTHRWDLFLTQIHFLDMAYHVYWGTVDPRHPAHTAESQQGYWSLLFRAHALADRFLGRVVEAAGEDAVVVVLGDHGQDVYHTNFLVNEYLAREGFLNLARDRRTGRVRIDWSNSVAYAQGHRVFLNVAGREPTGIVPSESYAEVADAVAESLASACDPRTGQRAVSLVLRGEDARSWGLHGPGAADLVVATAPGFQAKSVLKVPADAWVGLRLRADRLPAFRPTRLFRDFTGEHDSSLPLTRALRTLLFAAGPGIRAARWDAPVRLVDVAPTLAGLLGIPPPRDSEGSSLVPTMSCEGGGPC